MHAQLCLTLCDPMDCSLPGSSVLEILQIRIWSGLPFPPPENLSIPGIEPVSTASLVLADSFITLPLSHLRSDLTLYTKVNFRFIKYVIIKLQ